VHRRTAPVGYRFGFRGRTWLVDLDDVPALPGPLARLCRFDSADHLGGSSLRTGLDEWLRQQGEPAPARVLMLAQPRVLGYVFNPLTVFYCLTAEGAVDRVVAEVRNTYGGRHCYLVRPTGAGYACADKVFYVSPFYPVDGSYSMRLPLPGDRLLVGIRLHRPGERSFAAVLTGTRRPGRASLWTALRTPLATRAVMLVIRRHGISLYLKGLRPVRRPAREALPSAR
jgi:DUF1365 family protein